MDKNIKKPEDYLIAHRGYSQCFPENTLLAIQAALDEGAKYIEIDIQLTADRQAVVFHDRDLQRLCHQSGTIHDYTLKELQPFSSYSPDRFKDKYLGEKIATLKEVVTLFKAYPGTTLFVELKRISIEKFGSSVVLDIVEREIKEIKKQSIIISFSLDVLELLRRRMNFPIGAVVDDWHTAMTTEYERLTNLNPEYFFCDITLVPKKGVLHFLNTRLACYECTDVDQAVSVLQRGVDLIETFDIKKMRQQLENAL